jgi:hypothetical protein
VRGQVTRGDKGPARIGRRVEAVQVGQVADSEVDPVQAPAGEVIATGAGADVGEVERNIQAFVDTVQVALIAPHLKAFARDAFEERGEGGEDHQLRAHGAHGQAVSHDGATCSSMLNSN